MHSASLAAKAAPPPSPRSKWFSAKFGILCLVVTGTSLFLVLHHVHVHALLNTLRAMRIGWFLAAIALYGFIFIPAAWRWHLALRLNHEAAQFPTAARFTIIGHFSYLVLFGAAGGDAAKATLYARKHQLSLPKILAATSLDRLMGSGGLFLFAVLAFVLADREGGLNGLHSSIRFHWHVWMIPAVLAAIVLLVLIVRRSRKHSGVRQYGLAFVDGGKKLVASPRILLPGLICGVLMQTALNGVLALNLQAVTHTPLPWLHLAWMFPVINVISGLPITVAGIGARDGVALALLGMCGIAGSDAVAMSMLTVSVSVFWACVGGLVLWWELKTAA